MIRKLMLVGAVIAAGTCCAIAAGADSAPKTGAMSDASSLAAARAQISNVIASPKMMTQLVKGLSADDQKQFLADVNAAIEKLPASNEEKTALVLNIDRAALKGAAKGNVSALIAEVYATAPVYALTVVNEEFARSVLNRAANPKVTFTDDQYLKTATNLMMVVNKRLENTDDAGVRAGFAGLMMIRAANGASDSMRDSIIGALPTIVQDVARREWYPAALAEGDAKSYEPMLGMAEGEITRPVEELVIRIARVQDTDALLTDIVGANTDPKTRNPQANPVVDSVQAPVGYELPDLSGNGGGDAGQIIGAVQEIELAREIEEAQEAERARQELENGSSEGRGYAGQRLR